MSAVTASFSLLAPDQEDKRERNVFGEAEKEVFSFRLFFFIIFFISFLTDKRLG